MSFIVFIDKKPVIVGFSTKIASGNRLKTVFYSIYVYLLSFLYNYNKTQGPLSEALEYIPEL